MANAEWMEVDGFPSYMVSDQGEVINIKFGRPLKPRPNGHGYMRVNLSEGGVAKQFYVHRLVAHAFIEDYLDGMQIKHHDQDKSNNALSNLRLRNGRITKEQIPARRGRPPRGRRVMIKETGEVFLSARECARYIGGDYSSIYRCIRNPESKHKGYTFEYYEEK